MPCARTEDCDVQWITRFILFHHKRHPADMGAAEVSRFLTHLAVQGHVAVSTQMQALNASSSSAIVFAIVTRKKGQVLLRQGSKSRQPPAPARRGQGKGRTSRTKKTAASDQ
jgi:hypothetical protein